MILNIIIPRMRKGALLSPSEARALCDANDALDTRIRDFMTQVPSAREESITEYLLWQWRELDKRFQFITSTPHAAGREKVTGADFHLELWLVGRTYALPLLIQAKKFTKEKGHGRALRYSGADQLSKLQKHAKFFRLFACYLIYAGAGAKVGSRALHLVTATKIKRLVASKSITASQVVSGGEAMPLHDLFCGGALPGLPAEILVALRDFEGGLAGLLSMDEEKNGFLDFKLKKHLRWTPTEIVPDQVAHLLGLRSEIGDVRPLRGRFDPRAAEPDSWPSRRLALAVYDLRPVRPWN